MGKFIPLLLLASVALFLPRIGVIPGSGQGGIFVGTAAAAKSPAPIIGKRVGKRLLKAQSKLDAAEYDEAQKILAGIKVSRMNSYEHGTVLYYRAYVSQEAEDYASAIRFYDEALQLPDLPENFRREIRESRERLERFVNTGDRSVLEPDSADLAARADYLPFVVVQPLYPRKAWNKRIEGFAEVEFTVSEKGKVIDPVVVRADPPGYFEKTSLRVIRKFKYKPKMVNGKAVAVDGVRHVFRFTMPD